MLVQEKVRWCHSLASSNKVQTTSSNKVRTQYIVGTYWVHTSMYLVCTQYVLSTGFCLLRSDVTVQLLGLLLSTNSVHNILVQTKYVLSTYLVHNEYILVCTQYVLSTYSVQGYACCAVTSQSCYLVYFRIQTLCILGMAQCCNGMYYAIVQNHLYWSVVVHTSL